MMASLSVGLDLSSWTMWAVEGMRPTSLSAFTLELVFMTVFMVKMQE